jgi:hypothetical protein
MQVLGATASQPATQAKKLQHGEELHDIPNSIGPRATLFLYTRDRTGKGNPPIVNYFRMEWS